jgi:hypothetical protein
MAAPVMVPDSDSEHSVASSRGQRPAPFEMDELVEQEMQVWRDSEQSGMRRRRAGFTTDEVRQDDSHCVDWNPDFCPYRQASSTHPYTPSSPVTGYNASPLPAGAAALIAAASGPRSPSARSSTGSESHHNRGPGVMSPGSDHSSTLFSVSSRSSTPGLLSPQPQSPFLGPQEGIRSPPSRVLSPFSDIEMPTSPFADVTSPRPTSPFSDFMAVNRDPSVVAPSAAGIGAGPVSPHGFETDLLSNATTDDEMFSVASNSPIASDFGEDDLLSDMGSVQGSVLSGWENVDGHQR